MNAHKYILAFVLCLICGLAFFVAVRQSPKPAIPTDSVQVAVPQITAPQIVVDETPKSEIPKELVEKFIFDMNDNDNGFRLSDSDLEILHSRLNFELHNLNGDGISEYFLFIEHSDWCGMGSNCTYWVYQKTEKGYILLVEDSVLWVKETVTNGYRDLSSETPTGFCELCVRRVTATPYKFNGKKYVAKKSRDECIPYKLKY